MTGEETGFNTDAKNSMEKLSELLNIEINFLEIFLSIFLLNSGEKTNQSIKSFNWQKIIGAQVDLSSFIELLYSKVKDVQRRKNLILSGKINDLLEPNILPGQAYQQYVVPPEMVLRTIYFKNKRVSLKTQLYILDQITNNTLFTAENLFSSLKPIIRLQNSMVDQTNMEEFSKILLPPDLINNAKELEGIQDVRMFVQMISEKFPEKSIQLLLDHLYSVTFERGKLKNIPVGFYNFALLYCWITGRSKNVKVKRI